MKCTFMAEQYQLAAGDGAVMRDAHPPLVRGTSSVRWRVEKVVLEEKSGQGNRDG